MIANAYFKLILMSWSVINCPISKLIIINKIDALCLLIDRPHRSITSKLIHLTSPRFTTIVPTSRCIFPFLGMLHLNDLIILDLPSAVSPHHNLSQAPPLPIVIAIIIRTVILHNLLLLLVIHIITLIVDVILILVVKEVVTFRLLWIGTLLVFKCMLRTMLRTEIVELRGLVDVHR